MHVFGNNQGEKHTVQSLHLECVPDRVGGDLRCILYDCTALASLILMEFGKQRNGQSLIQRLVWTAQETGASFMRVLGCLFISMYDFLTNYIYSATLVHVNDYISN